MISGFNVHLDYIPESIGSTLNQYRNKEEIRSWCRQVGLIDSFQQERWLKKISEDSSIRMYLIRDLDNHPVGVCGLTDIDHINQRAEFSCYIFPEAQNKGHATNSLKLLFKHGFDDLNLNIIWGETFSGNHAYDLFIDKLGMWHEGIRRDFYYKNGSFLDAYLISITKKEFYDLHMVGHYADLDVEFSRLNSNLQDIQKGLFKKCKCSGTD